MKPTQLIGRVSALALLLLFITAFAPDARAQGVAGGTVISNRVEIQYTEPTGSTVSTVSNTVQVTVLNVTGLTITPDGGTGAGVNAGATGAVRNFTINNTGNITESITFGAAGASLITSGPITVQAAFVDVNGNGSEDAGDINILSPAGPLSMAFQTSVNVVVRLDVSPTASAGQTISLQLGDVDVTSNAPSHDNVAADASAGSVRTSGSTGVNGDLEARGDMTFTVDAAGSVLIGPAGQPDAVGPTDTNDDYTNKTRTTGVNVAPGGQTTGTQQITFVNTVRNNGNVSDQITLTLRSVFNPSFANSYEISTDGGASFQPFTTSSSVVVTVASGADFNVHVRLTTPANLNVLEGYPAVIRATSGITPQNFNETIDRMWTGFIEAVKSQTVTNATGVGGPHDPVPGAQIEYQIVYRNVTATAGTNNVNLSATNVVLTEDGNAAPNNWATTTTHIAGSASDSLGGVITGDTVGSSVLTDTIATLGPGQTGTFRFRRSIR